MADWRRPKTRLAQTENRDPIPSPRSSPQTRPHVPSWGRRGQTLRVDCYRYEDANLLVGTQERPAVRDDAGASSRVESAKIPSTLAPPGALVDSMSMNAQGLTSTRAVRLERRQTDGHRVQESADLLLQSVWEATSRDLSRLAGALGIDAARAEDLLQDVYLTAWQKQPEGLDRGELRRWLFRVTTNRCHLEHRRRTSWHNAWRGIARLWNTTQKETPHIRAVETEEQALVRGALGQMEPRQRSILVLRYFAEFDSKEIGQILELPDSTVRSHLRAARRQLAQQLKQAGYRHE